MSWMLILWELAGWSLLALSIWQLRKELRRTDKCCRGCGWHGNLPEDAGETFLDNEGQCYRGRGWDIRLRDGRTVSVVWDTNCCDCWSPRREGREK